MSPKEKARIRRFLLLGGKIKKIPTVPYVGSGDYVPIEGGAVALSHRGCYWRKSRLLQVDTDY